MSDTFLRDQLSVCFFLSHLIEEVVGCDHWWHKLHCRAIVYLGAKVMRLLHQTFSLFKSLSSVFTSSVKYWIDAALNFSAGFNWAIKMLDCVLTAWEIPCPEIRVCKLRMVVITTVFHCWKRLNPFFLVVSYWQELWCNWNLSASLVQG